jgi:predicted TIM-barrel fold metal-dependent hydrolase
MKIDIFTHILPLKYWQAISKHASPLMRGITALWDLEQRFRIMDKYDEYVQVLTFSIPRVEAITAEKDTADLARRGNDELAEILIKYPARFVAGVANLPMNNFDAALKETDRSIRDLGLKGVLVYSNINGKPLDSPEFMPLYKKMAGYDLPIWIHPHREMSVPDYSTEKEAKFNLHGAIGWPYETQLAMTRLVCSGVLEKYPNLKFITHHCGGGMPFLANRIDGWLQNYKLLEPNSSVSKLTKEPIEYLRLFYGDTAIDENTPALENGRAFFGTGHVVFGTDMPYGGEQGEHAMRAAIKSVSEIAISDSERKQIFEGNAKKLLHLR